MQIRKIHLTWTWLLILVVLPSILPAQRVPYQMDYCGIRLTFTDDARQKLNELVTQLTASPRYFNQMVRRAQLYMPYIEEALYSENVPEDLKYLAIQESGLQPSVVSSSQAVGFWQFKEGTGVDMGLQIDGDIDLRRHIFQSSLAAGRYFNRTNGDFNNWLYAVIAHYEGPTGAVEYTEAKYYGQKAMTISADFHWYALKAIAHKLAYEPALNQEPQLDEYLAPYSTEGETSVRNLAELHGLTEEEFKKYNPWILDRRKLPRTQLAYTYYVPIEAHQFAGHVPDPVLHPPMAPSPPIATEEGPELTPSHQEPSYPNIPITDLGKEEEQVAETNPAPKPESGAEPEPQPRPQNTPVYNSPLEPITPDALQSDVLADLFYAAIPYTSDLHYGREFVRYDGSFSVIELATTYEARFTKLLEWNELGPGEEPQYGQILYLVKPQRTQFHIVEQGEDLAKIAEQHGLSIRKLQRLNRMERSDLTIYVGQKLHLQFKKVQGEKLIVLMDEDEWQDKIDLANAVPPLPSHIGSVETDLGSEYIPPQRPRIVEPAPDPVAEYERPTPQGDHTPVPPDSDLEATPPGRIPMYQQMIMITHEVAPGETLWRISTYYGTTVDLIKQVNELHDNHLEPGQVLKIKVPADQLRNTQRNSRGDDHQQ